MNGRAFLLDGHRTGISLELMRMLPRIYLSTALVAMFVAAGLFGLNLGWSRVSKEQGHKNIPVAFFHRSGWPCTIYEFREFTLGYQDIERWSVPISYQQYLDEYDKMWSPSQAHDEWYLSGILLNVLTGVLIVFGISAVFERFIRMQKIKKEALLKSRAEIQRS